MFSRFDVGENSELYADTILDTNYFHLVFLMKIICTKCEKISMSVFQCNITVVSNEASK